MVRRQSVLQAGSTQRFLLYLTQSSSTFKQAGLSRILIPPEGPDAVSVKEAITKLTGGLMPQVRLNDTKAQGQTAFDASSGQASTLGCTARQLQARGCLVAACCHLVSLCGGHAARNEAVVEAMLCQLELEPVQGSRKLAEDQGLGLRLLTSHHLQLRATNTV